MNCSPYALNLETLDGSLVVVPNDLGTRDANAQALGEASSLGSDIFDLSEVLRTQAKTAADAAQAALKQALDFYPSFAPITLQTPSFESLNLQQPPTLPQPELNNDIDVDIDIAPFTSQIPEHTFTETSATPPNISSIEIQPPSWTPTNVSAPVSPGSDDVSIAPPPDISPALQSLPSVPNAPVLDIYDIASFTPQPIHTPSFAYLNTADLDRAISSFNTAIELIRIADVRDYTYTFNSLYTTLSDALRERSLEKIGLVETKPFLIDKYFVTKTAQYGHPSLEARLLRAVEQANIILASRWLYEFLPTLYDISVRAHKTLFDIETAQYGLAFEQSLRIAEFSLELLKSATAVYNANVAIYNAELIRYNAELASYSSQLETYKQAAAMEAAKADINQALVEAFAANEQTKRIQTSIYEAEIKQKAAAIRVYEAQIKAMSAQLAKQEAVLQNYKADVLTWEADIESILANYKLYKANLQAVLANIKTEEIKTSLTRTENRTIAAQAQIVAAQTSAKAAQIRSSLIQDLAQYELIEIKNSVLDSKYNAAFADYSAAIANVAVQYKTAEPELEGQRLYMDAAKTYMDRAAEYYNRAANLIQNTESRLARIRAELAETVGRTGAAIEQGKLAGFRASVSASADANISGAHGWGHTFDNNLSKSYSKGEHVNRSLSA